MSRSNFVTMSSIEYRQLALNLKQEETPCWITSTFSSFSMCIFQTKGNSKHLNLNWES